MKLLLPLLMMTFSINAFAFSGTDLLKAREAAIDEASIELDLNTVTAFKIVPSDYEIEVVFKTKSDLYVYGCHFHGTDMACHAEHSDHHKKSEEADFAHVLEGHNAALSKLEQTLNRSGSDLNILKTIKVWKLSQDHHERDGHEHGPDVWTKVTYHMNNKEMTVFIQCHEHADKEMACHYKRTGKDEPTL